MEKYELYGLYCPDSNLLKYVGITKNGLTTRLNSHLRKPTNHYTKEWFNHLKLNGKKPIIRQIKECKTYEELLELEIIEIENCRKLGVKLLNIADGGLINPMLGNTHSEEVRKKISLIHKGKKLTEEEKLKRKERLKLLWSDPEWSENVRKKMSYNTKGDKNPNWKGGKKNIICKCGNKKDNYSVSCWDCRDISGDKNPFFSKTHSETTKNILKEKSRKFGTQNPNFKYDVNKEELIELYIKNNMTIIKLSHHFNCAINTINKKLRQYEINKPKSNIYNLSHDEILKHLKNGLNLVQIGELFGCSNKIIHKYIKKHNTHVK